MTAVVSPLILVGLFLLLVLGVPLGIAFGLAGLGLAITWNFPFSLVETVPYQAVSLFPLLAIPLFMLLGELMKHGRMSDDLIAFTDRAVGRIRGALGYSVIAASALLSLITGSSVATVAAIGTVVTKPMLARGYDSAYIGAIIAAAALLGVLIPPSIPLVLYGSVVGVSVTQLLVASMVPGFVAAFILAGVHFLLLNRVLPGGRERNQAQTDPNYVKDARSIVVARAFPSLLLMVVIFGGLYSGLVTPTEIAGIAGVYVLLAGWLMRRLNPNSTFLAFRGAAIMTASIFAILLFTSVFNRVIVLEQVPQHAAEIFLSMTDNKIVFLLIVNVMLLVVGMFMETNAAILLLGPLLAPSAARYGIDPVHFGLIVVTNIELGLITPPLAGNLFVAAKVTGASMGQMLRYLPYFFFSMVAFQLLLTFWPALSLWYRYI